MSREVYVYPHRGMFAVRLDGALKAHRAGLTESRAVEIGRAIAKRRQTVLVVMRRDGTIRSRDSFGPDPFPPSGFRSCQGAA